MCPRPDPPADGFVVTDRKKIDTYPVGINITLGCGRSFILNGSSTITCQADGDGTWSPYPTCEPTGTDPCLHMYACMNVGLFTPVSGVALCY